MLGFFKTDSIAAAMAYFLIFLTQPELSSRLRRRVMVEFISLCVKNSVMGKIHTNTSNKMMMVIYINKICIISHTAPKTRFSEPQFSEILNLMNKLPAPFFKFHILSRLDLVNSASRWYEPLKNHDLISLSYYSVRSFFLLGKII